MAFLVAPEGVEQVELTQPWEAVKNAGGTPILVSTEVGKVQAYNHLTPADVFEADIAADDADVTDYVGLVLPGGVANPDQLRTDGDAVAFVKSFFDSGKPVAVICHGPWTLVEADVVRGRKLTSWPSVRTDILNAGGNWVDEEVVICSAGPNTLISSRKPDDLPAFCATTVAVFGRIRLTAATPWRTRPGPVPGAGHAGTRLNSRSGPPGRHRRTATAGTAPWWPRRCRRPRTPARPAESARRRPGSGR